jgi:hypothetical protein
VGNEDEKECCQSRGSKRWGVERSGFKLYQCQDWWLIVIGHHRTTRVPSLQHHLSQHQPSKRMANYAPALAAPAHYTRVPTLAQGGTRNDSDAAGAWVNGG